MIEEMLSLILAKQNAVMPRKEQIPGEYYKPGNRIRVFVLNVKETTRLPQVIVSHAHAEIVRELFELEVPEIEDGIVEIKSIHVKQVTEQKLQYGQMIRKLILLERVLDQEVAESKLSLAN